MNFYLLLLAYLAVACGVSIAAPAQTQAQLDDEFLNKNCPFGQRPAYVKEKCASGVKDPVDCPPMRVKCVQSSFGNTPHADPDTNGNRPTGVWKTQDQLDQELMAKECPSGQRAVQVKLQCAYGAKDTADCPPPEIDCVQMSFGNDEPSSSGTGSGGPRGPAKTQAELEQEMLFKGCPPGERPAFVKEKCPSGATNTADCPHMEVRCVQSSFGNDQSNSPSSSGSSGPEKTQEQLEQEMMQKECPHGQRAALVKEKCRHTKDTPDCPRTEVRCVQSSFGNDQTEIPTQSPERYFEENRWAAEHEQSSPGLHHSRVHPFRTSGSNHRW